MEGNDGWKQYINIHFGFGESESTDSCNNIPIAVCNSCNNTIGRIDSRISTQKDCIQCGNEKSHKQHFKCKQ